MAAALAAFLATTPLATEAEEPEASHSVPEKGSQMNRLAKESSPYLLQHASNPVDWYPWGEEALDKAKREGKPIFLSIGYSACHWCHVMAHESFENEAIAAILNEHFVSIKVDREERPDVDELYMTAVQMMTGSAGWPLSVFLTPDQQPFFGGTYFPAESGYGRPGFGDLLKGIASAWQEKRADIETDAKRLASSITKHLETSGRADEINSSALADSVEGLLQTFDARWGGFGGAPKFPPSDGLDLLLHAYYRKPGGKHLGVVGKTLDAMAAGGMYDQLGGGFHRYSVDEKWLVPHFEKMLYDNARLSRIYTEAYAITGRDDYRRVATETLDYLLRDMRDEGGAFHAAEDADSEGEEGIFYVWKPGEIDAALGRDATLFREFYGVTAQGNFEQGRSILHVPVPREKFASGRGMTIAALEKNLTSSRAKILGVRAGRVRPGRDDKVIVFWNGLTISSLARAYQVFREERFLDAAEQAARHILTDMKDANGLIHSARHGKHGPAAYLTDYAALANAMIDLYETTFDASWFREAEQLLSEMHSLFEDEQEGGFYLTSAHHSQLLARSKPFYDGAVPSGNSLAAMAYLRAQRLTGNASYLQSVDRTLAACGKFLKDMPQACQVMVAVVDTRLDGAREIVIVGSRELPATKALVETVQRHYGPGRVVALMEPGGDPPFESPLFEGRSGVDGEAWAYVCENYACRKPLTVPGELAMLLGPGAIGESVRDRNDASTGAADAATE